MLYRRNFLRVHMGHTCTLYIHSYSKQELSKEILIMSRMPRILDMYVCIFVHKQKELLTMACFEQFPDKNALGLMGATLMNNSSQIYKNMS